MKRKILVGLIAAMLLNSTSTAVLAQEFRAQRGYDIERTGLIPRYPAALNCSPLTSLYASWDDVDGTKRNEKHSGVDGGRLGDEIVAPADGMVVAAWKANWGWGEEGALLIRHSRKDLALTGGPEYYYSEFDHLEFDDIRDIPTGKTVRRGDPLAFVYRPGGKERYLPEVHWEVWEVGDDTATTWSVNRSKGRFWHNPAARLIDPLYMLARPMPANQDGSVDIQVYVEGKNYTGFQGFTYILPCPRKVNGSGPR
jgi:murein DD-endopeptidase MepM/ murein hydrolase activator NlpD